MLTESLAPIARTSVFDEVSDRLVRFIISQGLRPGDKLPPERELVDGPGMPCVRGGLERIEKARRSARRERHEIVIVEPDQRRFQHAGEHEIVLRKQSGAAGCHEIHDGDMMREFKAVGASRADLALFQSPNHRLEKRPA